VQSLLTFHGVKMIEDVDRITRKSMACPAMPLCGLAMTEAERVQPMINGRLIALMDSMGLGDTDFVTRTTGCPNGCARPYMAEMALVGSGPDMYQVWLGGHPAQGERTAEPVPSLFKMKMDDLEKTFEPIFCMYKVQREKVHEGQERDLEKTFEAFGTFCHRVGVPAIEEYMKDYVPGSHADMPDPHSPAPVTTDETVGIDSKLLAVLQEAAEVRGLSSETLLDTVVREALLDEE
jgi:sulfite reductase (ferredoxin)